MAGLLDPLSDAYLLEIARHFARQDVPYPQPQPASAPADVLQRGRELAQHGDKEARIPACASCHGASLMGVAPNVPGSYRDKEQFLRLVQQIKVRVATLLRTRV